MLPLLGRLLDPRSVADVAANSSSTASSTASAASASASANNTNVYEGGGADYDPTAPVPHWHQNMELITICVVNALSLIIIIIRVCLRRARLKRFRADDLWIAAAGVVLIFPHWVCQIGTNRYGSGLHADNIPDSWLIPYWKFEWGWSGYYLVCSLIKVSVCYCILEILPHSFLHFRIFVYVLCFFIMGIGLAEALVWLFQCQPVLSNFIYAVYPMWCLNIEAARFAWVAISVAIDFVIVSIPFILINRVRLKVYERRALQIVFGATLLGTCTCLVGIYGIWVNRNGQSYNDQSYTDTIFIMTNDIEIFMYTLGASATALSKYFVSRAAAIASRDTEDRPSASWPDWSGDRRGRWDRHPPSWYSLRSPDSDKNGNVYEIPTHKHAQSEDTDLMVEPLHPSGQSSRAQTWDKA